MRSTRGSTAPSQRWHPKMLFPCLTLHRKGVAWPWALLPAPVVSYTAFSPSHARACGMFLWPDPEARASPGVTWLPALWCTDFPHRQSWQRAHPTDLSNFYDSGKGSKSQLRGMAAEQAARAAGFG